VLEKNDEEDKITREMEDAFVLPILLTEDKKEEKIKKVLEENEEEVIINKAKEPSQVYLEKELHDSPEPAIVVKKTTTTTTTITTFCTQIVRCIADNSRRVSQPFHRGPRHHNRQQQIRQIVHRHGSGLINYYARLLLQRFLHAVERRKSPPDTGAIPRSGFDARTERRDNPPRVVYSTVRLW